MFEGRKIIISTKHSKEQVIAPLLEKHLHVKCFVPENFDTDKLGTFSGEIEREHDPITTLRNKCLMAMEQYNCDLGIASEGSFGAHPTLFFVPADDEFVMLIDKKNGLEIVARELSTLTNFSAEFISTEKELKAFAEKINFPSHGLIIKKSEKELGEMQKGITDWNTLNSAFQSMLRQNGKAYVETDMRAMMNPTRMSVIEKATEKLIEKIKSTCPQCNTPGFSITDSKAGLPCENCGFPTKSTLSYLYQCAKCSFTKEEKFPKQKTVEDPMYCDICNP